ncbi:MAG: HIT family protein [Patescibacteria group bacterium]|nr:HIT family protein [Patescibacteria group bacterium]
MSDCIFCKIVNKEIPADIVFENDMVMAFLDNNPISLGHVLIVPKKHFTNIYDIEEEYLKESMIIVKKISLIYKKVFGINGVQIVSNAGDRGEQKVRHFHFHLIPREENDNLDWPKGERTELKSQFNDFITKLKDNWN